MDNTNCFLQNIYIPLKIASKEQQLALDYLKSRGISTDTAEKYDIQYCVENGVVGLIIQTGDKSFVTRFINPKDPDMRYRKRGSAAFFNFVSIEKSEEAAIFVTEGEFDCLSILQAGYEAVSLGGVANVSKFMSELKNTGKRTPLILALDNDRAGREAIAEMKGQAKALGIACLTGRTPVVFIDYLQMIPATNDRYTDKQNIDKIMLVLRQMKNQGILLFVISSLSRASYDSPISMSSFKESGNIEFGTDVALALDFEAMYNNIDKKTGKSAIDLNYERRRDPRKVALTVLKNWMGETGTQISYDFYPDKNIFKECGVFYPHT